jgi:osmoprotectant transport system ATP-binding protein
VTGEPSRAPAIRFDSVVHSYGGRRGVDGVTLEVAAGSFCVLLGQSGSGKTTLLKTANRLLEATGGRVFVEDVDVMSMPPALLRRRIGYAIQAVGLFPHMRVRENIAVVPELLGWDRTRIVARVDELLDLVHLPPAEYRDRFPRELSGGQQQRVGLARSLAGDPAILLMDEPFGAVDAIERAHLQDELASLHQRLGKTVLFVTHDVEEALRLADTIAVMRDGRVEQSGAPLEILARPATAFVADLVGSHDALRLLAVMHVADALDASGSSRTDAASLRPIRSDATLREALSMMAESGDGTLSVERDGARVGYVTVDGMLATLRRVTASRG